MTDPQTALIIAAVFVLAGLVKGAIGLGLPTVAVGLLGLVMPPAHAAALLVVPSLVTNAWQLLAGPAFGGLLRRLWPMLAGIGVGTWLAAGAITAGHGAEAAMGAALIAYGAFGLLRIPLAVPPRTEVWLGPLVGVVNGVITAATGIFVLPSVPYLQALGLGREDLIQALGLSFTASTLALAAALGTSGAFPTSALTASLLALAPALLGMAAGTWLRSRVRPETFRRWFFSGLVVLGADLVFSGLR
jgi:uncharacterized membrane protein YfcA